MASNLCRSDGVRPLVACLVVVLSLAALAAPATAADPVEFGVSAPDTVEPGETVTLNVTLDSDASVYALSFDARVDNSTAVAVESGGYLGANPLLLEASADGERATYSATRAGVETGVNGTGTVATITVSVPDNASGPVSLTFADTGAARPNATRLQTTATPLTIPLAADASDGGGGDGSGGFPSGGLPDDDPEPVMSDEVADATGDVAVVASVDANTSLDAVAGAFRTDGARAVYRLPAAHAVGARVAAGHAETLAGVEGVRTLRTATEATPTGTARVAAHRVGAGRVRAAIDVPPSVTRVAVDGLGTDGGAVTLREVAFDAPGANGTLTVTASDAPADAPLLDGAVGGFNVSHPEFEATNVSLRFGTNASGPVTLYRLADGSWDRLPTERVGSATYRAESPGLSVFLAAPGERSAGTTTATVTTVSETTSTTAGTTTEDAATETSPTTETGTTTGTVTTTETATTVTTETATTASGPAPGFTALAALLAFAFGILVRRSR